MSSTYYNNLISEVQSNSVHSDNWFLAKEEWDVIDCEEDDDQNTSCICGKENLRFLFTIRNRYNGYELFPIGSVCIKKFDRQDLNEFVSIRESLFTLLHHIQRGEYIELSSDFFSRNLLGYFLDENVFANDYNGYDGQNDYDFFLKMFNKKNKFEISTSQRSKINAIIIYSIKPYLLELLKGKYK